MSQTYAIPGVYRRPHARAEGFPRVRTDVAGFVGAAGPIRLNIATAVDDWKSYVALFRQDAQGRPVPPPPGGALDPAVRDFFANGGRRLWIVNVAEAVDPDRAQSFLNDMLGIGVSLDPHGLELLLRQDEVSLVALPDFDAVRTSIEDAGDDAGAASDPCFRPCGALAGGGGGLAAPPSQRSTVGRLYGDDDLIWAQRYLIERLGRERWRWFAALAPPPGANPVAAVAWRRRLTSASEGADIAALYWPWLLAQTTPGAPVELRSPVGAVVGAFAASDIASGPQQAPANIALVGVVGLDVAVGDAGNRTAYDAGVNVIRAFPGRGVRIWGARTLLWRDEASRGEPLAFVNTRRCLSAIARSAWVVGQPLVFEPNSTIPRIRLHQLMTDYLLRVFASGALMGDSPDQGFFVQVEPAEASPEGQLVCRIGVALAAPAEFIVFRIGRDGGVIEFEEAA